MNKDQQLSDLFAKARSQAPQTSFEETKTLFVQSLETQGAKPHKGPVFTLKNGMIMSISLFLTATIALLLSWPKTMDADVKHEQSIENQTEEQDLAHQREQDFKFETEPIAEPITARKTSKAPKAIEPTECFIPMPPAHDSTGIKLWESKDRIVHTAPSEISISFNKDSYRLPQLTDDEIKKTVKQKKKMMKELMKPDARVYAFIPAGSFDYFGEMISVASYYMQRTEVTNFEYRTFLFDLVMQQRTDDFLAAKPDEAMWTKSFGPDAAVMVNLYFSHPAYDNYPVINIPRTGAELYCKWLFEEAQKYAGEKALPFFKVRIPTRQEWVNAASVQGKNPTFPWGGESIQNDKQCYLANHKPTDSTYFDDGGLFTVRVNSYTANDYGLYNMSGNVAEMVVDGFPNAIKMDPSDSSAVFTPGTAGGGWMNTADEVQISAADNHPNESNPHPNIGFRVVMSRRW
jgi:formylglycine-generating enzyme required for sulfatase activity